jgi:hypothetical protein
MSALCIYDRAPAELKPRLREFRTLPAAQIERLMQSLTTYGVNAPVAIDKDDRIVCGAAASPAVFHKDRR